MIIAKLSDGLGNQMFQYALGRRLALANNDTLKLDLSWFNNRDVHGGTDRTVTIDGFDIDFNPATETDINSVIRAQHVRRFFKNYIPVINIPPRLSAWLFHYYREVDERSSGNLMWAHRRRFYPGILDIDGDAYIDGYWQANRYVEGIRNILLDDFTVSTEFSGANKRTAEQIKETTAISVHVRRGDQIDRGPSSDKFGNAERPSYYYRASKYITERIDTTDVHFYIFSDDPEWCQTGLNFDYPTTVVDQNDGSTDYKDIQLMRLCNHHIIASSTFSWWGAWLCENKKQIVVAPKPWKRYGYPDGILNEWNLIPENWILLPDKRTPQLKSQ
jgi:hypothetical protein